MEPRFRDLPRVVLLLALALARGDRFESLAIAQLVRGLAVQVALRWWLGQVLVVPGRAVLTYTELEHPWSVKQTCRAVCGLIFAVTVGVVLSLANKLVLIFPLGAVLLAVDVSRLHAFVVLLAISMLRLAWTAVRAVTAYRIEHRREKAMLPVDGAPRWRLELMGANPLRQGHGLTLVQALTKKSDAVGATVFLVCEPVNHDFYRRAGFRAVPAQGRHYNGMLLMRRVAPSRTQARAGQPLPRRQLSQAK